MAEMLSGSGLQGIKGKVRRGCGLPDFYKGWVSKHNPYTILKRIPATKKLFNRFNHDCVKDVDMLSTLCALL
jgi:hypothetical protein